MKKVIAILLLLCLCPLGAWAETKLSLDEQAIAELNHTIYEANQLDAIFSRHASMTISFNHPYKPDFDEVIWETEKRCFRSWGETGAQYEKDNTIYRIDWDKEMVSASLYCMYDYDDPYFYCFVSEPEENFYNPEHDHMSDCFEENGLLYLTSEYDETLARKAMENEGLEYAGQTVMSQLIVDAETYDIVAYCQYVEEDGEETVIYASDIAYDEPEPLACRVLRAAFEHESRNMMNVTYAIDKGTDHEITRTLTVPVNTDCGFKVNNVPYVYFYDPDYTTLFSWDRMSDHTLYVITNPSEELIERFQKAYEAVMNPADK